MRIASTAAVTAALLLSGCGERIDRTGGTGPRAQGRYAGIGTFEADRLWERMAGVSEPKEPAAAKLADDTQIIVVIDSHTGEVRQCGNHSGHCVTMNPWAVTGQRTATPVTLSKHAADLDAEAQTAAEAANPSR